ncbi:SBBP repeat-containing protein [Neolewinella lacunae]|uniref:SBBP repeat-containing protein n=1 Tax=Neolewinella lacunae TaxID=1517758 RepID=A0A923PM79_9BACT|nr:choice-of-anchor E domain-containing protein [Neolewinella lacunae]MBC6994261.1 SBBP repeat-containing protein [Neolewinella lacunae]MDN3637121.1 SBBP repeat-containing protein [Neolewinella lacunae]
MKKNDHTQLFNLGVELTKTYADACLGIRRNGRVLLGVVGLVLFWSVLGSAQDYAAHRTAADVDVPQAQSALAQANAFLRFEQNVGQFPEGNLLFKATDAQATYFFTQNEIRSVVASAKDSMQTAYALQFVGANEGVDIQGIGRPRSEHGATNYMTAAGSFGDVPMHNRLHYTNLWDGVNAHFYESREGKGSMKYDFIVQPNADPSVVRLKMDGVTDLKINAQGELEFTTPFGTLQKGKPYTYQMVDGKQVEVASEYTLNEQGEIGFKLGNYNASLPLVIDPIALKWSTYLMAGTQQVWDIYVHPTTGRIYLVGQTQSASFPNTLGRPFGGGITDAFVTCMEKDGTTLVWSTFLGGSGTDIPYAVSVDTAGDVYVAGSTSSTNFPVNGTTTAYDASHNGNNDIFVVRLNSTGATLKYSSYVGGGGNDVGNFFRKLVVSNGKVYVGSASRSTDFPTTTGAYQASKLGTNDAGVLFCLNTNVGGAAGLEMSTFFNDAAGTSSSNFSVFSEIEEDKDGNLWLVGYARFAPNFPISDNAVQKYADFGYTGTTEANFVAKFSKTGQYLYSSWVHPLWSPSNSNFSWGTQLVPSLDVDAAGNVYIGAATYITGATATTVKKAPNILAFHELSPLSKLEYYSNDMALGYLAKIPYDLSPQYDFVSVFPSQAADNLADPEVAVDKKGNIHLLTHGGDYDGDSYHPLTAGAVNTVIQDNASPSVYYVLPPSGNSVLYGTVLNSRFSYTYNGMFVNDDCEAYLISISSNSGADDNYPITPSYRDFETNTQKTVYNGTTKTNWALSVFHEPVPNGNTINNFAPGNNTFCVGGLIYQNPNDGPILGSPLTYTSGNGSSASHNLPNIRYDLGPVTAHPTPASPAIQYQWQKSLNGGATWVNIPGGNLSVLKPDPESAAGTVQYRRTTVGFCCDALVSNVATATIAGNFDLQINGPTDPVYYCPGTAEALPITITGASGNISWQWYNGFSPATASEISPASGSGTAASFAASIPAAQSMDGQYRLVVTDAGGCKREYLLNINRLTMPAFPGGPIAALCPGSTGNSIVLGPTPNPLLEYSWTGPGGFTSSLPNPEVTVAGDYFLRVRQVGDPSFCAAGETMVNVPAPMAHDVALTALPDVTFCQDDNPTPIGLSGAAPAGYVFQWSPGINLDNQQAYSPSFDPGSLPFGQSPIATVEYTFTALRLSDGCIYEDKITVTDVELALPQAGSDQALCGGTTTTLGRTQTTGQYFQWAAVSTTFPGGLAALVSDPDFLIDGVNANSGTGKFATVQLPAATTSCYNVFYVLRSSFLPFANTCFATDTVRVTVCPPNVCSPCPEVTANAEGTDGVCSGENTILTASSFSGLNIEWTTYSVNGVVQPANTPPQGLFTVVGGTKGVAIAAMGPHPNQVVPDINDGVWGWGTANVVVYRVRSYGFIGNTEADCSIFVQVFSDQVSTPVIGVLDKSLCTFPAPGVPLTSGGMTAPYTVSGVDYTQAPNSSLNWTWAEQGGGTGSIQSGGDTPFPTLNPSVLTNYVVTAADPVTGCQAMDIMQVTVVSIVANAGSDISTACEGALVQLGTAAQPNHSYSWSPTVGLNFPIGTPNSMTAQPFLILPSVATTYTVTVTESTTGCQATDEVLITPSTTPPAAITPNTYSGCPDGSFRIRPASPSFYSTVGNTFAWTAGAGADIAWLSATNVYSPTVTLPAGFTGPATFNLTITKGTCGSVSTTVTIDNTTPNYIIPATAAANCTAPLTQIGITGTATSGYTYVWSPAAGLFTNSTGTTPYNGTSSVPRPYVLVAEPTTYTLTVRNTATGCVFTDEILVSPPAGVLADAGPDQFYCPSTPITIGGSSTGTSFAWTAVGYNSDPIGTPATPTAGQQATMLGYLSSTTAANPTFNQTTYAPGKYVYRISASIAGCTISDEVTIIVPVFPTDPVGQTQSVCLGESVQIGPLAPNTLNYVWSALSPATAGNTISNGSSSNPTVTPTTNTIYQAFITDGASGCQIIATVLVTVTPSPVIDVVMVPVECAPATGFDLTAQIPNYATYSSPSWTQFSVPGAAVATPTSVSPTQTINYFLVAANEFGCTDTARVTVNVANPQTPVIAPSADVDCQTLTADLTAFEGNVSQAGYTFEWHTANNTLPGTLVADPTMVGSGTYYLFEKANSPANCYSASDAIVISSAICEPQCNFTTSSTTPECHANGTPEDGADDYFTFSINVANSLQGSLTYTVTATQGGNPIAVTLANGLPATAVNCNLDTPLRTPAGTAGGGDIVLTITDNVHGCTTTISIVDPGTCAVTCVPGTPSMVMYSYDTQVSLTELNNLAIIIPQFDDMGGTRTLTSVNLAYGVGQTTTATMENSAANPQDAEIEFRVRSLLFLDGNTIANNVINTPATLYSFPTGIPVPASGSWPGDVGTHTSSAASMPWLTPEKLTFFKDPRTDPRWVTNATGNPSDDDDIIYFPPTEVNATGNFTYSTVAELAPFIGNGFVPLSTSTLSGLSTIGGGGNIAVNQATRAYASAKVTYTYECAAVCVNPTATLTPTAATCTGSTANNDGTITLAAATNATHYGVSLGATYTGPTTIAGATAFDAGADLPLDIITNAPNVGATYVVRLFNGADDCFVDEVVMVAANSCGPPPTCDCTDYIYLNDEDLDVVHKFRINGNGSLTEIGSPWLSGIQDPHGIASDLNGNNYIAEFSGGQFIWKVSPLGTVIDDTFIDKQQNSTPGYQTFNIGSKDGILYAFDPNGGRNQVIAYELCTGEEIGRVNVGSNSTETILAWGFYVDETSWYIATRRPFAEGFGEIFTGSLDTALFTSPATNAGVLAIPTAVSPMGVTRDNDGNYYVITNQSITGNGGNPRIRKYSPTGVELAVVNDNTDNGVMGHATNGVAGWWGARGIIFSPSSGLLYVSSKENCVTVFDTNLNELTTLNIGNPLNGSPKGIGIVTECCPTQTPVTIEQTL